MLLLMFMFMPWGINQVYKDRQEFFQEMRGGAVQQNNSRNRNVENRSVSANTSQARGITEQRSRGERGKQHEQEAGYPAP
uniref:hypothetical protein n=1 Tax=Streptomyces brasiliscabiei TaxID=2736302 RepID=UPI0038F7B29A